MYLKDQDICFLYRLVQKKNTVRVQAMVKADTTGKQLLPKMINFNCHDNQLSSVSLINDIRDLSLREAKKKLRTLYF